MRKGQAARESTAAIGGNEAAMRGGWSDHLQGPDQHLRTGQAAEASPGALSGNEATKYDKQPERAMELFDSVAQEGLVPDAITYIAPGAFQ